MLSLRSGWLPFYQEKGKSPSAADLYRFFIGSRGKPARIRQRIDPESSSGGRTMKEY